MPTHPNQPWDSDANRREGDAEEYLEPESQEQYEEEAPAEHEPAASSSYDHGYAYPRRRRILPTLIAVVLLISAVACGAYFWMMRQKVESDMQTMNEKGIEFVEAFIDDLKNERVAEAYKATSAGFRQRTNQWQFDEYVRKHREVLQGDLRSHEFKVPPTTLVAFGKKVTGEYRAPRKVVAGASQLFIKVVREEGALKVEDMTITR